MIFDDIRALPPVTKPPYYHWEQGPGGFSASQIHYPKPMTYEQYVSEYEPEVSALGLDSLMRSNITERLAHHFAWFFAPAKDYLNLSHGGYVKFCCAGSDWPLCRDDQPSNRLIYVWCRVELEASHAPEKNMGLEFRAFFCNLDDLTSSSWGKFLWAMEKASKEPLRKALHAVAAHHRSLTQAHGELARNVSKLVTEF